MRFAVLSSEAERRDGLKALLRQIDRHARFCEARDWIQINRAMRRVLPELLVIDWQDSMRAGSVRTLLGEYSYLRVAAFVDDITEARVRTLVDAGVHGVIPRATNPLLIVRLLELVVAGGITRRFSPTHPAARFQWCYRRAISLPSRRAANGSGQYCRRGRSRSCDVFTWAARTR